MGLRRGGRGIRLAALLLPIATTTCAGHLPPCPAAGGPAWTELESAHFRLRTDLEPAAGRAALTDLERLEAALLTVFGVGPDVDTGKVPVVVVKRGWTAFASVRVGGYFTYALFQPLVVMVAGSELHQQEVIKHELVHYLSHVVIPRQPLWFAEGLATYYETIEVEDSGRITVGRPSEDRLLSARRVSASTITNMFAATEVGEDGALFYAAARITMHYLMNHRTTALIGYEKALRAGESFEAAWKAGFGAETPAQLAGAIARYLDDGGQYQLLLYRLPPYKSPTPIERPLGDADAHATRALLYLTAAGEEPGSSTEASSEAKSSAAREAKRELDEAFRQDPDHNAARAILHWSLDAPVDLERASAAARKTPGDWLAWLLLAEAHAQRNDAAGRQEALARATELARADRSVDFQGDRTHK